jgi:uncharacterized protein (TIGR02271 family)
MPTETIVAVFDTAAHAQNAISDLVSAGVPASSIEHYAREEGAETVAGSGTDTHQHRGFWAWLTGEAETTRDHHALYDQSIQSGGTVVTVITDGSNIDTVYDVLQRHDPVDLDERHSQYSSSGAYGAQTDTYGLGGTGTGTASTGGASTNPAIPATLQSGTASSGLTSGTTTAGTTATGTAGLSGTGATAGLGGHEEVIPLAEESLQVGKREVDRGTTRVRRYVVERPVEEQIRLRNETVTVFRRAPSGASAVAADAFTDREVVVTETAEEAVVGKTARVVDEVVVQKGVDERTETVRDTVRREEIDIDGPHGVPAKTTPGSGV